MDNNNTLGWRDSSYICTLSDGERHLGHIVNTGHWNAFDATCLNEDRTGCKHLGLFLSVAAAKAAVEDSVVRNDRKMSMAAAGGLWIS
ncbi:MAG: hypothetical protein ABSG41_21220 [Bryobacteraceae bacterium]|jgi:hypothetical protein